MKKCSRILLSLFLSVLVWCVFTWPLPKYVRRGIPSSAHNVELHNVRTMIPGDHLQLLYHFWLAQDTLTGGSNPSCNLYEFNLGDDDARFYPSAHFAPFSLFSTVISIVGTRALGYNMAGLLSIWLTLLFTWILIRRYAGSNLTAGVFSLLAVILPYRWISLLEGSPAGFAMAWIPLLWLGLDMAVRDRSTAGGWLAGIAVLFSCWGDTHVFFFGFLSIPFWCIIAATAAPDFHFLRLRDYLSRIRPFLPLLALTALTFTYTHFRNLYIIDTAEMSDGRSWSEVCLYSPRSARGFTDASATQGFSRQLYIGYVVVLILFTGMIANALEALRTRGERRRSAAFLLMMLLAVGVALLALGAGGPFHGRLIMLARRVVPPYRMIRQPTKILCLLPPLLAILCGISVQATMRCRRRRWVYAFLPIILTGILVQYITRIDATVCELDTEQQAYRCVAEDSRGRGVAPHVVVVPLWPGDSAWSSLYQYYVSLYRIRMVNGYTPAVPEEYFENIFRRFESINKGVLTKEQLAALQGMGIQYVLLHEDAFPEKVSPFPVSFTLRNLLDNPHLELLRRSGSVWAFKIGDGNENRAAKEPSQWRYLFPSRWWEGENCPRTGGKIREDEACSSGRYIALEGVGDGVRTTLHPKAPYTVSAPALRWLFRVRGAGSLAVESRIDSTPLDRAYLDVDTRQWQWMSFPTGSFEGHHQISFHAELEKGAVDLDTVILAAGDWPSLSPGNSIEIPAACFFHAGYTDLSDDAVQLRSRREPDRVIFYGLRLPLEPGRYAVNMTYSSDADPGIKLGRIGIRCDGNPLLTEPVVAQERFSGIFVQTRNLPTELEFTYSRAADVRIESIRLKRIN